MSRVGNAVLVLVALVALGFAAVLSIEPTLLPAETVDAVVTVEESLDPEDVLVGIAAVVGLFALWRSYFSGATDVQDAGIDGPAPNDDGAATGVGADTGASAGSSTRAVTDVDVVGAATTERVARTIDSLERGQRADRETDAVAHDLRETLAAVEAARGRSGETAAERIRTGAWTDDRIAATFLGDESAGRLSIWHRLRMWLFPARTFERRLGRTLDELEQYATSSPAETATRFDDSDSGGSETTAEDAGTDETSADDTADEDTAAGAEQTESTAERDASDMENETAERDETDAEPAGESHA